MSEWTVIAEEQGLRLDRFLAAPGRLGSRGRVHAAIDRGQVFVNEVEAGSGDAAARLTTGDRVRVWLDRPGSARRRTAFRSGALEILYEDETLLVVNKPAGLLSVPLGRGLSTPVGARNAPPSVYRLVADYLGRRGGGTTRRRPAPFIVHRIDRDTSGIVVFAKTAAAQHAIKDQFARHEPERVYWAVVHGRPHPARGRWRDHLAWDDDALKQTVTPPRHPKSVEAISHYRVLEMFDEASLVEVRLHTGKRNQIRIQAARRGHPLIGERQYASGPSNAKGPGGTGPTHARQALHAHRLSFAHPVDGRQLTFEAPLPADLTQLLRTLRTRRDTRKSSD